MTPRTEYGARVVCPSGVVYVKDFSRPVVLAWMAEYGAVASLWAYPASHADGYAQSKRLTDAELAAEYYRAAFLHENSLAENDGYDGMPETQAHRNQSRTLHRFATLPHYDEPAPDLLNSTRPTKAEER